MVLLLAQAQAAQLTRSKDVADAFLARLVDVFDRHADCGGSAYSGGGWGNLRPADGPSAAPNDLGLSAQLLLAFLQGLCGLHVQGGVTQAQYVYTTLGIGTATSTTLPAAWDKVAVRGIGPNLEDIVLLNNGGNGSAPSQAVSYTTWGVSSLTL
jgi:hypothetical protein